MNEPAGGELESLFHAVRMQPREHRSRFLKAHCTDSTLRAKVEQLVACAEGLTVIEQLSGALPPAIPRFRLLEILGEGGFGVVYRAEQLEPVQRIVAIKMSRGPAGRDRKLERFKQEMQILARLDHPRIARLYETGQADDGRAFVVMECVQGDDIVTHCHKSGLSIRQRVELLVRVCDAVHHAHQNGILHRDLKPGNILVARIGECTEPRIIDFGVARWLHPSIGSEMTLGGELIGTPAYMSPEQASGRLVDVRADVFSLGAVLYELLTGAAPIHFRSLPEDPIDVVLAKVRDADYPLASVAAGRNIQRLPERQARRRAEELRDGLDAILDKALQRSARDRYASVSEFAADLRRYLSDETILAQRPTLRSATRRFVRRHRTAVVLSIFAAAACILGLLGTSYGFFTAMKEARNARAQYQLLLEILTAADVQSLGENVTVRSMLDAASARLAAKELPIDEELIARTRAVLGHAYAGLGRYDDALREFCAALDSTRARSELTVFRAGMLRECADALRMKERWNECELALAEAIKLTQGVSHESLTERIRVLRSRSHFRAAMQHLDAALEDSWAAWCAARDFDHCPVLLRLECQAWHGTLLRTREYFAESEATLRSALNSAESLLGKSHLQTATVLTDLADTLLYSGRPADAEPLARRALEVRSRVLGSDHPLTINSAVTLASCCAELGSLDESRLLRKRALAVRSVVNGPRSEPVAVVHYLAGLEALDCEEYDRAKTELEIRLNCLESRPGEPTIALMTARAVYSASLILDGDYAAAAHHLALMEELRSQLVPNPSVALLADACAVAMQGKLEGTPPVRSAAELRYEVRSQPMLPSRARLILNLLRDSR